MVCLVYGAKNDPKEVDGQAQNPRNDGRGKVAANGRKAWLYRICSQEVDNRRKNTTAKNASYSNEVHGRGSHAKRLGFGWHKKRQPVEAGKRGFTGMLWPEDRIATLRSLHQQGYSGTLTAEKMGMTRGQVLGKAWRLGISFAREQIISKPRKPVPLTSFQAAMLVAKRRQRIEEMKKAAANQMNGHKALATKPGNVTITGLTSNKDGPTNCRAIVDGEGVDAVYCGQPVVKRSYCEDHFGRFYYRATSHPIPRY